MCNIFLCSLKQLATALNKHKKQLEHLYYAYTHPKKHVKKHFSLLSYEFLDKAG